MKKQKIKNLNIWEEREKKYNKLMTKEKLLFMKHQHDPFEEYRTELNEHYGGIQKRYKFPNGWGASVICHRGSYGGYRGLWELAVELHGIIVYDTAICADVIGHLTTKYVHKNLQDIKEMT